MAFEGNSGISRLAGVIATRMREECSSPLAVDFGEVLEDKSLVTNTFPVPVPKGEYSLLGYLSSVSPGSRVLVAWVASEAVVLGTVKRS